MQKVPTKDDRKLLPRWRPLARVPALELASSKVTLNPGLDDADIVGAAESRWRNGGQLVDGVELLESAVAFGREQLAEDAARELLERGDLRPLGRKIAHRVLGDSQELPVNADERIRRGKELLKAYPRNGVLRSQMALVYVSTGQRHAAVRQIEAALRASPANRFVLRSAARFFVHDGEPDRAISAISKSGRSDDPWIMATQVSLADMQRDSRAFRAKDVRSLLNSGLPPAQLVELAIAFATLEISHGAIKPARKLISLFREHLNENAAAQIKWIEETQQLGFEIDLTRVDNSFEASTLDFHNGGEWLKALLMAEKWFADEPFSTRAAILGSYIASAYAERHETSVQLIDRALVANPNDVGLLNNKAFALSQSGKIDEARLWLSKAAMHSSDRENKVVLGATEANILVRSGAVLEGLEAYARSAISAARSGLFETRDRMIAHWLREMYLNGYHLEEDVLNRFEKHFQSTKISAEARRLFSHIASPLIRASGRLDHGVPIGMAETDVLLTAD